MKNQSILFVDQYREVGGGQIVLQGLMKSARHQGFRVGVLAPRGGGLEKNLTARLGGEVTFHDLKQLNLQDGRKGLCDGLKMLAFCLYALRFLPLVARHKIIYVNGCRLAPAFLLLSLLMPGRRWLYHVHLCHSRVEKFIFGLISLAPGTHQIVMASSFIRDDFFRSAPGFCRHERFVVLENCLDPVFAGLSFRNAFLVQKQSLTVALIGRVSPEKGHDVLPRLARRFPTVRFLVIGRTLPGCRAFLDSLLAEKLPNLIYLGETARLAELLAEKNVQFSLVPSRWEEPFGLTAIESMAASCITLVSEKGMLPLIAKRTGALCFANDEQLEQALARLFATDPFRLHQLAQNQFERVQNHFGTVTFFRQLSDLLRDASLTGSRHPRWHLRLVARRAARKAIL
jgi:glycosyltransferase involved in cell wall biosynthesis